MYLKLHDKVRCNFVVSTSYTYYQYIYKEWMVTMKNSKIIYAQYLKSKMFFLYVHGTREY